MSFTRLELETKRCGVPRKSAGSITRRIASEMVLWCMHEGVYERDRRGRWFKQGLRRGEIPQACRKIYLSNLHNIVFGFGLLSIVEVQLADINKILPFLLSKMTLEISHILKHN